ncbi:16S rRNA (guanine(527)-N(7))-methyltransferase RsmG [Oscillatoria sp. FACHB-1407]|uniref:16S rRNA (guanine(527)-N(7))-methyltransferase RsmG n=1 Tax=Oscillatoria sp. FACHB-1407 TaxID=2692847 RepID=UPI0016881774|nr:16S rRNA (guanine(527)-N(7))-methyltransferase RsmG [Oscillatoria sp. FACHB-1407]MBD2461365.1 16S rRNA (guanine(527)-N(7))-methyltransferase RsmG [Oscillatoria sp. FACHB-1407]
MTDEPQALPQAIETWQTTLNWQPTKSQQAQLQTLYELILAGNRQLNLTRITEPDEFWEKHIWDSLRGIVSWQPEKETDSPSSQEFPSLPISVSAQVIDIGTGGGFPGIPVAIAQPKWRVTLLDSTRKKMAFLDTVIAALGLPSVTTVSDRAESLGQHPQHRAHYDLALVRAVAEAPVCAEYALPLLKLGGFAVLYRGQWSESDTDTLKSAVAHLGGAIAHIAAFTTPLSQGIRHCIYLQKTARTPSEFPRAIGVPAKQPLG